MTYRAKRTAKAVSKIPTGITGLDEVLEGGVPEARAVLVLGGAGAGKTVFMNEFLYRGITQYGQAGVLVTFEERPDDIVRNVASFGWDYAELMRKGRLAIVDASPAIGGERELSSGYDLEPLLMRIRAAVRQVRAKRLILDSLEGLFGRLSNRIEVREMLFRLSDETKRMGVTTMIAAEREHSGGTRHGVEDFVADAVIELSAEPGQQKIIRRIIVRKIRGAGYRSGNVQFGIDARGLEVYPKVPVDRRRAATRLDVRKRFGIRGFDELLGGGVPEGYMLILSGNTGSGKSTFAQHFIAQGIREKENAVFVALEEPTGQVEELAAVHGWNFAAWRRSGRLDMLDVPLIDIRPDEVLYRIVNAVRAIKAKRVVLDSISSLRSATMDAEQVRQFMIQLGEFAKASGVTCVMTYLVPGVFSAARGQLLGPMSSTDVRLSSAVDGVILQRYVERQRDVRKILTVLKLRGVQHDTRIHAYSIGPKGVEIGGVLGE